MTSYDVFAFEVDLSVAGADYHADLRMEYRIKDDEICPHWVREVRTDNSVESTLTLSPLLDAILDGMWDEIMAAAVAARAPPTDDRETDR